MRLICPNCSAQYEIDATMIPDEGRDVQCSNCGHTWFELPPAPESMTPASDQDDATDPDDYSDPTPEMDSDGADNAVEAPSNAARAIAAATDDVTEDDDAEPAQSEPFKDVDDPFEAAAAEFLPNASETDTDDSHAESSDASDAQSDDDDETGEADISGIAPTTLKARRPADAADVDILREEAERELSKRRAPPSESLESQSELGLEDLSNRKTPSRALRARMAQASGDAAIDTSDSTSEADYQAPQRDLLPDIDEINSTLSQNQSGTGAETAGRGGFRWGFGLTVLLAVAAVLAYAFAPNIASAVPGTENALIRFVDLANQLRDWIDGLLA